ncbi:hypothetical protein IP90_00684 [Luteimonas cucumeris]|uniref:Uncharacterized protein n=1 Tax=Luteimonas cucumeris TaxID=985012 RepID=A0A562LAA1_9GAMM|nr:hypothetical protein [Luteimonas cucumeris]TWI04551.1 hypothetical protein IP90_00684 [Luteimonas cucumeris]
MSDHNPMPTASMSDDMLLSRLFELVRNGELHSPEVSQLDAAIHQRLEQNYDDSRKPVMKLMQAA